MNNFILVVVAASTLLEPNSAADRAGNEHELPNYTVHRADSRIQIDGRLNESAWQNAATFGDFQFAWWKQGAKEQTVARMLWDKRYLYVSYECRDAHVSAEQTERDSAVYRDDCVEFFVAPNPLRPQDYFNIEMNVNAAILDQHHPEGPGKAKIPNWNAQGIRIATTVNGTLNDDMDKDRGWVLEVAIPFDNFAAVTGKTEPRSGDVWHVNLNRLGGKTNPQFSQWSPGKTPEPAFHAPDTFGRVTFSDWTSSLNAWKSLEIVGYEPVPHFFDLPDTIKLGPCSAVAINSMGNVYMFHRSTQPILCFDAAGTFVRSWGDAEIGTAHGMRIDSDDNIWVTDIKHHMVFQYSPTGKLLLTLGTKDRPGKGNDQFDRPTDVAFGPDGAVFVADGYGNSRIVKFDRNGEFISTWGTPGNKPGQFDLPHCIVVDSKQRLLVGDRENDRIQIFDLNGRLLTVWNGFAPFGIALDKSQRVFIADGRANQILRLNDAGKVDLRIGSKGRAAGQLDLPHMLAIGRDGSIVVAEVGSSRFQKFAVRD